MLFSDGPCKCSVGITEDTNILYCKADGHPSPKPSWISSYKSSEATGGSLDVCGMKLDLLNKEMSFHNVTCIAVNAITNKTVSCDYNITTDFLRNLPCSGRNCLFV